MNTSELVFECCYCGEGIKSSPVDPCALNVLINFDKDKQKQYDQEFFCHLHCFKKSIRSSVPVYLEHLIDE